MEFPSRSSLILLAGLLAIAPAGAADATKPGSAAGGLAELLKATGLTETQALSGVKSGLGTALSLAAAELTKPGAFQLSGPSSMAKLQSALVRANQSGALEGFKNSLNQAASSVAPQATAALKEALGGLTLSDANLLTGGTPDGATRMLRKTAEPLLRTKLMPLVKQAVASNGSAAKIKELAGKAGPMAGMLGVPSAGDLENYVLSQVVDTSFGYLGKQEAALRANPSSLKDAFAAKVFSAGRK